MSKKRNEIPLAPKGPITDSYKEFKARLRLFIQKNPDLMVTTLSNIFTMRLIGNKTHGDLAEIAIAEFINQYMYDYKSLHVGKDLYRAKSKEEDITITNELSNDTFPVSLKAYGDGPLQLSTDKTRSMFPRLEQEGDHVVGKLAVQKILADEVFTNFNETNVLPLIYDEKKQRCNILTFEYRAALSKARSIQRINEGSGRKHPVYRFFDDEGDYICEVRYGGASANALQRGLWTHTKNGLKFFESLTGGWIDYSHNHLLVALFSHSLVASDVGHSNALEVVKEDIKRIKTQFKL
jgi:hypothetical protein